MNQCRGSWRRPTGGTWRCISAAREIRSSGRSRSIHGATDDDHVQLLRVDVEWRFFVSAHPVPPPPPPPPPQPSPHCHPFGDEDDDEISDTDDD